MWMGATRGTPAEAAGVAGSTRRYTSACSAPPWLLPCSQRGSAPLRQTSMLPCCHVTSDQDKRVMLSCWAACRVVLVWEISTNCEIRNRGETVTADSTGPAWPHCLHCHSMFLVSLLASTLHPKRVHAKHSQPKLQEFGLNNDVVQTCLPLRPEN